MSRALFVLMLLAACGDSHTPSDIDAAAAPDAAVENGPDAAAVGVPCGDDFCEQGTTQGCCVEPPNDPLCEPTNGLCLGDLTSCDGPEDCTPGDVCCDYGQGPGCGAAADCTPRLGGTPVCHGPC